MKNFIQPGFVIPLAAPYARLSGEGAMVDSVFGVATVDVAVGVVADFNTTGVFELAKTSAQAWTVGMPVFWDNTNKRCDSGGTLGSLIGHATEVAANPTAVGRVKLQGIAVDRVMTVMQQGSPAPISHADVGPVTLTAAELLAGIIVVDTNGAGRTYTLPTAALLVAAVPGAKVGDLIRTYIINGADAAEVLTLAAGTGGAFDANQTASSRVIGQNTSKMLFVRLTNVTAASEAYVAYS